MPKRLGTDAFTEKSSDPYEELFGGVADGDTWLLTRGSDYRCSETNLRRRALEYAERRNLKLRLERVRRGDRVIAVELAFFARDADASTAPNALAA